MSSIDFRADQIRTGKIIASSSTGVANPQLLIYPVSSASNLRGGVTFNTNSVGSDVYFYIHGTHGTTNKVLFGGDIHLSHSLKFASGAMNMSDTEATSVPYLSFILDTNSASNTTITQAASFVMLPADATTRADDVAVSGGIVYGKGGKGSDSTSFQGSPGGYVEFDGGRGGNALGSTNRAGAGGSIGLYPGQGGRIVSSTGTGAAGAGGALIANSGPGGNSASGSAGEGGSITLIAGNGGDVVSSGSGGFGGNVLLKAGQAGTSKFGAPVSGGNVFITAGSGSYDIANGRYTGVGGNLFLAAGTGSTNGNVYTTSGALVGLNGVVATYSPSLIGGATSSLADNLIALGMPSNQVFGIRNATDSTWLSAMILHPSDEVGNDTLAIGDVLNGFLSGNPKNRAIHFHASTSNGASGQHPFAQFSPAYGSFYSGSITFPSGAVISLSSIVATYTGSSIGNATQGLDANLVGFGVPYSTAISSRNKVDDGWISLLLLNDNGAGRNIVSIGDGVGANVSTAAKNTAVEFYSSGSGGTAAQARFSQISGSYFSGSMEYVSGGVNIGPGISNRGTGNLTISGSTLGLGSVLGIYPGGDVGGLTSSLAANLVAFGMQYQTQFAVRDKLDQSWMTAFLYADEGSKLNNLYIGDFIGAAFGSGTPLNKSIKFYVSSATATGQTPFARFDALTGSFISGTMIFPGNGTVILSGSTRYVGATFVDPTIQSTSFTASVSLTTYYLSSSTGITCSLPSPAANQRWEFIDVTGNAAAAPHTIAASGSLLINGASTYSLNRSYGGQVVVCVGTGSYIAIQ